MSTYYSLPHVRLNKEEDVNPLTDDVKNFLLATSDYGQEIQSDIDLYVTHGKHNEASFRRKLDPIKKNV